MKAHNRKIKNVFILINNPINKTGVTTYYPAWPLPYLNIEYTNHR